MIALVLGQPEPCNRGRQVKMSKSISSPISGGTKPRYSLLATRRSSRNKKLWWLVVCGVASYLSRIQNVSNLFSPLTCMWRKMRVKKNPQFVRTHVLMIFNRNQEAEMIEKISNFKVFLPMTEVELVS